MNWIQMFHFPKRSVRHWHLSGITKVNNQNRIKWGGYLTLIRTGYFLNGLLLKHIKIIFKGHTTIWERNWLKQKETFKNFPQILCFLSVNTATVFLNMSRPLPSAFSTHYSCSSSYFTPRLHSLCSWNSVREYRNNQSDSYYNKSDVTNWQLHYFHVCYCGWCF